MTTPPSPPPLAVRQNEPDMLRLLVAKKYRHGLADIWANTTATGTVGFALLVPLVAVPAPTAGPYLSAVAALWLVLGKSVFRRFEQRNAGLGIAYQELFETELFGLDWNSGLGPRPRVDDAVDDAGKARNPGDQRDWFIDTAPAGPPADYLLAQLESAAYGRRNHRAYARWLTRAAVALFLLGVVVWIAFGLSLTGYLIAVAFPSLPALQDSFDLAGQHRKAADAKHRLETLIDEALTRLENGGTVTAAECRAIQDTVYEVRLTSPSTPTWYFHRRETQDAAAIRAAIRERLQRLQP